jgi:hypothetical protein
LIVGGESGHGARPYDFDWARLIIQQCKSAAVPVFHKQVGADPVFRVLGSTVSARDVYPTIWGPIKDSKGGEPSEWPEDLRVREMPAVRA